MYYEFYIDQFFVQQFVVGCLLLAAAAGMSGATLRWRRTVLGSLFNALCVTVCILTGCLWLWPSGLLGAVLAAFWECDPSVSATALSKTEMGSSPRSAHAPGAKSYRRICGRTIFQGDWRHLRNCAFCLLMVTIFFGGALEALLALLPVSLAVAAFGAFALLSQVQKAVRKSHSKAWKLTEVTIFQDGAKIELQGLWDTGNQLREPLTGRPVSIADAQALKPLLKEGWEEKRGFCLIPYHSLGAPEGWIRGVVFDEMHVRAKRSAQDSLAEPHPCFVRGQDGLPISACFAQSSPADSNCRKVFHHPVIALYDGSVSTHNEYQIILHPDHAP